MFGKIVSSLLTMALVVSVFPLCKCEQQEDDLLLDIELQKCHHRILGVKATIDNEKAIKRAFRQRAKLIHPDKNKNKKTAKQEFHLLNEALDFMMTRSNRVRLRNFLQEEENKKFCGWRFDHPIIGKAFDSSWWLMKTAASTGLALTRKGLIGASSCIILREDNSASVKNLVYLDDSASMAYGVFSSWLDVAHPLFQLLAPLWQHTLTQVVLFGSDKNVVVPMAKSFHVEKVLKSWKGRGGSTYMWHMIEQDILNKHVAKVGTRFRVFVVTDGHDNGSPGDYSGVEGMNPMMSTLVNVGYDIEFHIVILGNDDFKQSGYYKDLARATGGNFFYIDWSEATSRRARGKSSLLLKKLRTMRQKMTQKKLKRFVLRKRENTNLM